MQKRTDFINLFTLLVKTLILCFIKLLLLQFPSFQSLNSTFVMSGKFPHLICFIDCYTFLSLCVDYHIWKPSIAYIRPEAIRHIRQSCFCALALCKRVLNLIFLFFSPENDSQHGLTYRYMRSNSIQILTI